MGKIDNECLTERTAKRFLEILRIESSEDKIRYLKCKLGMELLLVNLPKLVVVYFFAVIVQLALPVMIFHISFLIARRYSHGAHASSSLKCTIISVLLLLGTPLANSLGYIFQRELLTLLGLLSLIINFRYAPSATKKNPIRNMIKRKQLRKKALLTHVMIVCILLFPLPITTLNLVIIGAFSASVLLIPKTHEIL